MSEEDAHSIDGIALYSATHPVRPTPWWKRIWPWIWLKVWRAPTVVLKHQDEWNEYHHDPIGRTLRVQARAIADRQTHLSEMALESLAINIDTFDPYVWISPAEFVECSWPVRAP